jgi:acetyltransferase-like isoleucine patch superfamily enzyme
MVYFGKIEKVSEVVSYTKGFMRSLIHPTALVAEDVYLGSGTQIWANTQVREGARLGKNCIVGKDVYIGPRVEIGDNCKIQNGALLYEPTVLSAGVFVGPGVIFTNDHNPRAINPDKSQKSTRDWTQVGVVVGEGASIGAGVVCIAPIEIGNWAVIGAGSVVTKSVQNYSLSIGSPARQVGWVGRAGYRLIEHVSHFTCPNTGARYVLSVAGMEHVSE